MQLPGNKSITKGLALSIVEGFTLIELMIVIAIMGIIFSMGYASYQSYLKQQGILTVVRSIQSDLRFAEEAAISGNKAGCPGVFLGYQFTVTSATAYTVSANCSSGLIATKTVSTIPNGITIAPVTTTITFKALGEGISPASTTTLILTQPVTNITKTITIGANGSIQ